MIKMFKLFTTGLFFVCLSGICPQVSRANVIPTTSLPEQGSLMQELVNHRKALREGAAEIQKGENRGSEGKKLAEYMINELKRRTPVAEGDEVVDPRTLVITRNGDLCDYNPSYCSGCESHQFECANGLCIPGYWECDSWNDCGDMSDEVNCACADDEFSCTSGECIPDYWQCDQEDDCYDASDEQGCAPTCGGWGDWGEWSECNAQCGAGQRHRTRVCPCEPATLCQGENTEYQMCHLQPCLPEAGCGGTFTTPTGLIQTPTHLGSYRHSQNCSWIITVSDQRSVLLVILGMDIEAHPSCDFDYIEIYDGVDSNSPMLTQRLCGTTPPTDAIISSGASMLVRFVSDSSVSGDGFVAVYQEVIAPTCGGWDDWGEWSECNAPCGAGQTNRTRVCPCEPATLCRGENIEYQMCHLQTCPPEAGCGGTFTTPTGLIQTPTHLGSYRHSQNCSWIITVSDQRSVSLRILSMDIEAHPYCGYDYIEIYDGVDSNSPMLAQRLCGTTPPTYAIISSGASMLVRFVSDSSVSGDGFVAVYQEVIAPTCGGWDDWGEWSECNAPCGAGQTNRTRVCPCEPATLCRGENIEYQMCHLQTCPPEAGCGGTFTTPTGLIQTPTHLGSYRHSQDCSWIITVSDQRSVSLRILSMDIEAHPYCDYDYIEIYDGVDSNSPMLAQRLCGTTPPTYAIISSGASMLVRFVSDSSVSGDGFVAVYQEVIAPTCGGWDDWGEWSECNAPCGAGQTNRTRVCPCEPATLCRGENIEYQMCHLQTCPPEAGCGGTFTTPTGLIQTPTHLGSYRHSQNCSWIITVSDQRSVSLRILSMDIEAHPSCVFDYIEIYDGVDSNSPMLAQRLCGTTPPTDVIISSEASMLVRFVSDRSVSGDGFVATYQEVIAPTCGGWDDWGEWSECNAPCGAGQTNRTRVCPCEPATLCHGENIEYQMCHLQTCPPEAGCGGTFTTPTGLIQTPTHLGSYRHSQNCSWIITVSDQRSVSLRILSMDIEVHYSCDYDYIEIYDGVDSNSPMLAQRLCGTTPPTDAIISSGASMLVRFVSDSSVSGDGFVAVYQEVIVPECGGWDDWGEWSECNASCGAGQRQRTRVCPCEPATLCHGENIEYQMCHLQTCPPEAALCGGSLRATEVAQVITSPNYPNVYPHNTHCTWYIDALDDTKHVRISFTAFDVEDHSSCSYDYLEMGDFPETNGQTLRYCGSDVPLVFYTAGRTAKIYFMTDGSLAGTGFSLTYTMESAPTCGGWGEWGEWSECNVPCGQRHRTRVCPCEPATLCQGENTDYQKCQLQTCLPEADSGCGTRQPADSSIHRIVGGHNAARGAWPWYAQLLFRNTFLCGGTLVDNKYIVTAAHCVSGSGHNVAANWTVILGKNREDDNSSDEHVSDVTEIIIHENYDDSSIDNDIAVMVLASPPPEDSQFINSVCLDTVGRISFESTSVCFIAGFGTTEERGRDADVLQEAMVPLVNFTDCNFAYHGEITDNMICAGYEEGGIDTCQGDSGGPLVCSSKDETANFERWYLTGITSWGYGCARPNFPGVYTNMARYGDWLENVFASHNGQ